MIDFILHSFYCESPPRIGWPLSTRSVTHDYTGMSTSVLYAALGLVPGVSIEQVKTTYKKLAREHHPDKQISSSGSEVFKQINFAYHAILDIFSLESSQTSNENLPVNSITIQHNLYSVTVKFSEDIFPFVFDLCKTNYQNVTYCDRGANGIQLTFSYPDSHDNSNTVSLTFYTSTSALHVQGSAYPTWVEKSLPLIYSEAEWRYFHQFDERNDSAEDYHADQHSSDMLPETPVQTGRAEAANIPVTSSPDDTDRANAPQCPPYDEIGSHVSAYSCELPRTCATHTGEKPILNHAHACSSHTEENREQTYYTCDTPSSEIPSFHHLSQEIASQKAIISSLKSDNANLLCKLQHCETQILNLHKLIQTMCHQPSSPVAPPDLAGAPASQENWRADVPTSNSFEVLSGDDGGEAGGESPESPISPGNISLISSQIPLRTVEIPITSDVDETLSNPDETVSDPPPPTTIVVAGSSLVRGVAPLVHGHGEEFSAVGFVYPGRDVREINKSIRNLPDSDVLVLAAGANNIEKHSEDECKRELFRLFDNVSKKRPDKLVIMSQIPFRSDKPFLNEKIEKVNAYIEIETGKRHNWRLLKHDCNRSDYKRDKFHFNKLGSAKYAHEIRHIIRSNNSE